LVVTEDRRYLKLWAPEWPLLNHPEVAPQPDETKDDETRQVHIEEQPHEADALEWMAFPSNAAPTVMRRLPANLTLKPLLHRKWRQPATAFLNPEYVAVTSLPWTPEPAAELGDDPANAAMTESTSSNEPLNPLAEYFPQKTTHPDYSIDGQVAFSQQRFTHLHVKMNLFRINEAGESIVHAISQQRRVNMGEWQYFDHQQFGVLAKVTEVSLQPPENEENEHETDPVTGVDDTDLKRLPTHSTAIQGD